MAPILQLRRSVPTLTVCMIVKNEAAHLPRCLESVREVADDLVVVDTGSSDATREVARRFGARVFELPWPDDFSAARNVSLAHATGDWILAIDADESIAARDHARLRAAMSNARVDGYVFPQRHYLTTSTIAGWQRGPGGYEEGAPYPGFVDIPCTRFFRNRPWLRFRNRVHEEVVSLEPLRSVAWGRGDWVLHHFGKVGDGALLRAKAEAYLQLGLAKVADRPDDPQAHYELGVQYLELDRAADALASFARVAELLRQNTQDPRAGAFDDVQLRAALCHSRLAQPDQALAALRLAAPAVPHLAAEIAVAEGNAHLARGDAAAAEQAFRRAVGGRPDLPAGHFNLALACARQGRVAEALACLDRTIELAPSLAEPRMQRALLRRDAGDEAGALTDLEQLGADAAALRLRARILLRQGRYVDADASLTALAGEDDAETAGLRGAIALGRGDVAAAVQRLRRSVELGASYEALRNLSTALAAHGDCGAALAAAVAALRLAPGDAAMQARVVALTDEPAVVPRIAAHLVAGRAALAQRMVDRDPPPPGLDDAWQALRDLIAWRAGTGQRPSVEAMQLLARQFRSLERSGLLESGRQ